MKQDKATTPKFTHIRYGQVFLLVVGLLFLYAVLPKLGSFGSSWSSIRRAEPGWLLAALAASGISYLSAAGVYVALSSKRLAVGRTTLVQLASNFANRLVPAGLGAISVNFAYLRKHGHSTAQASALVLLNNVVGFAGNMLLLLGFIMFSNLTFKTIHWPKFNSLICLAAVAILLGVLFVAFRKRAGVRAQARSFILALREAQRRPLHLIVALMNSMVLTLCYSLCLFACTHAVGLDLSLATVLVVMSLGVAGATVTPTPGGLGGAEAALVAGLIFYGASDSSALAAALLYRLYTYWLPLLIGGISLVIVRRRKYL